MRRATWGYREVFIGAVVAGVAELVLWLAFSIASGLPGGRFELEGRTALLISAGFELFFVLVAFYYAVVKRRGSLASLGFVRPRVRYPVLLAIGGWLVALGLSFGWNALVERNGWEWFQHGDNVSGVVSAGTPVWLVFLVVAVVAPFSEEIFFRGFAYSGLRKSMGPILGALTSAALFSLFHVDVSVLVPIFIFGIVLAWIYIRSGSIWPSMFAHALHNAVVLAIAVSGSTV